MIRAPSRWTIWADSEWASQWGATREVSDRSGGRFRIPGAPWHFSADTAERAVQHPAAQGEHNAEILKELGFDDAAIAELTARAALVQPSRLA